MGAILERIIRLRKLAEQRARLEAHEAQMEQEAQRRGLEDLAKRVADSHGSDTSDPEEVARHHAFALRSEMNRRQRVQALEVASQRAEERREQLLEVSRGRRVIEEVQRAEEERERVEALKKEQKELDETGIGGWWRSQER